MPNGGPRRLPFIRAQSVDLEVENVLIHARTLDTQGAVVRVDDADVVDVKDLWVVLEVDPVTANATGRHALAFTNIDTVTMEDIALVVHEEGVTEEKVGEVTESAFMYFHGVDVADVMSVSVTNFRGTVVEANEDANVNLHYAHVCMDDALFNQAVVCKNGGVVAFPNSGVYAAEDGHGCSGSGSYSPLAPGAIDTCNLPSACGVPATVENGFGVHCTSCNHNMDTVQGLPDGVACDCSRATCSLVAAASSQTDESGGEAAASDAMNLIIPAAAAGAAFLLLLAFIISRRGKKGGKFAAKTNSKSWGGFGEMSEFEESTFDGTMTDTASALSSAGQDWTATLGEGPEETASLSMANSTFSTFA